MVCHNRLGCGEMMQKGGGGDISTVQKREGEKGGTFRCRKKERGNFLFALLAKLAIVRSPESTCPLEQNRAYQVFKFPGTSDPCS